MLSVFVILRVKHHTFTFVIWCSCIILSSFNSAIYIFTTFGHSKRINIFVKLLHDSVLTCILIILII